MTPAQEIVKLRLNTMRFCLQTVKDVGADPKHQTAVSIWNNAVDLYWYMTGEHWPYHAGNQLLKVID